MSTRAIFRVGLTNMFIASPDIEREVLSGIAEVIVPPKQLSTEDEMLDFCRTFDGLLLSATEPITRNVIEGMPNLKVLARYGIGVDNVDLKAATERGVFVTNVPDYGLDEVADHAFTLVLATSRKLFRIDRAMKREESDVFQKIVRPLNSPSAQVLGLLGFGNIGRRVAARAKPFGYKVIAFDPWVKRWDFSFLGVERVTSLGELLSRSDVISIHVSLGSDSKKMIGEKEIRLMKPSSYIVNTSRGAVIDEGALIRALREGWIAGAGLDVLEKEPIGKGNPLLGLDNVILTPHISWYTEQSEVRLRTEAARAVADALSGRTPEFVVNPDAVGRLA